MMQLQIETRDTVAFVSTFHTIMKRYPRHAGACQRGWWVQETDKAAILYQLSAQRAHCKFYPDDTF